ncbi:MAG: LemA family protein [Gemmatimonadota bacterium]
MRTNPLILAAVVLSLSGCGYNQIQSLDERVNKGKADISTQLQRRADLIPNLVNTVKGVTKQEDTVFISIANARAKLSGAIQSGDPQQMAEANQALNAPLGRLLAITENYPELKSSENFRALQDELTGTENRIAVSRTDYNGAVNDFNAYIRRFPYNITAKITGHSTPRTYFEAAAGTEAPPAVKF